MAFSYSNIAFLDIYLSTVLSYILLENTDHILSLNPNPLPVNICGVYTQG